MCSRKVERKQATTITTTIITTTERLEYLMVLRASTSLPELVLALATEAQVVKAQVARAPEGIRKAPGAPFIMIAVLAEIA